MRGLTKSLIVTSVVGTLGLGGMATAGVANAVSSTSSSSDSTSSLIDKIASTFNIDKTKVQSLFDENQTALEADRAAKQATELQKLVDAKTITAVQKTAIEAKIAELKKQREADKTTMNSLTDAERKAKMDAKRTELETWAKAQGIDLTKLNGILGGGHRGPGGGM
ncbi:MAG: hypothetical protein JWN75_488 [Candidatus Saccharibacteria bacterium]|nr:hypothetical protein [Candidatus Saccharibacteria bacterium]